MTCYHPLKAWAPLSRLNGGAYVFDRAKALNPDHPVSVECGQCVGCRFTKVEQKGLRCLHESQMHQYNSFLTLTYSDEHLPDDYSVHLRTLQLFMKRLRKMLKRPKIRFYGCGEYGDTTDRPHYHVLLFGEDFHADREFIKNTPFGALYRSPRLEKVWQFGHSWIGSVTPQSARYVAGYVMKKMTGDVAASHYLKTTPKGVVVKVEPEFGTGSKKPGLGSTWFDKFASDVFPSDFLVVDGKQVAVPKYYYQKLEKGDVTRTPKNQTAEQTMQKRIARARASRAAKQKHNSTPERLAVREYIKKDRISRLKREL